MKHFITLLLFIFVHISLFGQDKTDTIVINETGVINIEIDNKINEALKSLEEKTCPVVKKVVPKEKNNSLDPCANSSQINGYKIQIYYSKNRAEADKIKNEFTNLFNSVSAQVVYFTPDYKVLVGDYLTKNSASKDIRLFKSKYNNAFSIPYKVLCRKAK